MKRIYSLVLANLLAPLILSAAPCVPGLLSTYIGASCTNFGITFDTWTYAAGDTATLSIDVTVFPSVTNPVFEFTAVVPWTAAPGVTSSPSIGFHATTASPIIVGSHLLLATGGVEGTGSVTLTMSECLDGLLFVCSPGTFTSLITFVTSGTSHLLEFNTFAISPITVDVLNQMTIVGGSMGARNSSLQSGFFVVPVPEPLTMELTLLGVLLIVASRRWMLR